MSDSPADGLLPSPQVVPTRSGYDQWAEIYDEEDNSLVALEEPVVRDLLGDVRGVRIADVGCGTGRHALPLAAAGACVTAMDFSQGMLAKARGKPGAGAVRWLVHDLARPLPFRDGSFDRVLSCLVLEHVADLRHFFAELRRVCHREGFILVSAMHPAMVLRGVQARFFDPVTRQEIRPAGHPYRISDYVAAALQSGLRVSAMVEACVDAALAERMPRARKYLDWPVLLAMRLDPA